MDGAVLAALPQVAERQRPRAGHGLRTHPGVHARSTSSSVRPDDEDGEGGAKSEWDGAVVAVLGLFDKSKTFVLNRLTETDCRAARSVDQGPRSSTSTLRELALWSALPEGSTGAARRHAQTRRRTMAHGTRHPRGQSLTACLTRRCDGGVAGADSEGRTRPSRWRTSCRSSRRRSQSASSKM